MEGAKLAVAPFYFPRGTLLTLHPQSIESIASLLLNLRNGENDRGDWEVSTR